MLALELLLAVAVTVAVGVFYAVVLGEALGPFGSLARAWRLMSGSRWRFFGLLLLYGSMVFALSIPIFVDLELRAGVAVRQAVASVEGGLSVIVDSLWSVIAVAAFIEMRLFKEGAPHDHTAQEFV